MNTIQKEVLEILRIFQRHDVKYVVIGGFAVNYWGYARMTVDLDLWIDTSEPNYKRLVSALDQAGFGTGELRNFKIEDLPPIDIPLGDMRIELLPEIPELTDFNAAKERASILEIEELKIPILSREDLILTKKGSVRKKDQDDIEHLT